MIVIPQEYSLPPRNVQTGGVDPGAPRVLIDAAARSAQSDVVDALIRAGRDVTQASLAEYVSEQSAAVSEALQEYRETLSRERDRYMRTNRGKDAIDAERHFDDFSFEAAQPLADRFSGRFRDAFMKDAAATGLHFAEEGRAYGRQQRAARDKSVFEGDRAQTLAAIAGDPGNREFIRFALDNLRERHAALFPDADHEAASTELGRAGAGAIIEGFLAKDNLEDARGAFEQYRDFLGESAAGYERKIASKGRQLAARHKAEAKRARLEQEQGAVLGATGEILNGVQGFPSLETQRDEAFALADAIAHPAMRGQVRTMLEQEFARRETRRDAIAAREIFRFREQAKGWLWHEALNRLAESADLSETARERLRQDPCGESERVTPANAAALDELRRQMDLGAERGGINPDDADAVDAFVLRHGLTRAQARQAHAYAGATGKRLTQTRVNRICRSLFPESAGVPPGLYDRLTAEADPDKAVSEAQIRRLAARLHIFEE